MGYKKNDYKMRKVGKIKNNTCFMKSITKSIVAEHETVGCNQLGVVRLFFFIKDGHTSN